RLGRGKLEARQDLVAGRPLVGQGIEKVTRLGRVAVVEFRDRLAKLGAGLLRPLLLPIGPELEAGHAADNQRRRGERIDAVFVPQLLVAVLADGIVHLPKKITVAHWRRTLLWLRQAQILEADAGSLLLSAV